VESAPSRDNKTFWVSQKKRGKGKQGEDGANLVVATNGSVPTSRRWGRNSISENVLYNQGKIGGHGNQKKKTLHDADQTQIVLKGKSRRGETRFGEKITWAGSWNKQLY